MQPTRKTITLPSGATVKVRKLSALDLASEIGEIKTLALAGDKPKSQPSQKDIEFGSRVVRIALTKCTGKIVFGDSAKRIVDKHFSESDDATEITIEELDQADADAIVSAVFELSGIGGATASVAKFPEEQAASGAGGQAGAAIQEAAP